jgi:ubiquinone/menaquinone biosynthesis C-methylase UbiE
VSTLEPLDRVFGRVLDANADDYDAWLYRYCGRLANSDEVARYRTHLVGLLEFGGVDARGVTALDAGCGFGFAVLLLRSLGAADVHGVDISEPMLRTVRAYLPLLPPDLKDGVHFANANVDQLPYVGGSFDLVLSVEAISHYRDVDAFISEAARVLHPGGVLLIHDHNNARNRKTRRETRALWEEFETGLPSEQGTKREREGSYRLRREEIIRDGFPELSDATVADLVARTAYMSRDEILAAVRDYEAGDAPPASFFTGTDAPVDPNSGAVVERTFDPYELADRISASGFSVKVAGYWGGAGGNRLVRLANAVLAGASRLTIGAAPAFTIAARRL